MARAWSMLYPMKQQIYLKCFAQITDHNVSKNVSIVFPVNFMCDYLTLLKTMFVEEERKGKGLGMS